MEKYEDLKLELELLKEVVNTDTLKVSYKELLRAMIDLAKMQIKLLEIELESKVPNEA